MPDTSSSPAFLTEHGLRLHRRDWRAAQPRARILLVHGLGEHGGRYARLGEELSAAGFSVCAYDHRGHGQSEGPRGRLDGHDTQLAHDLLDVFQAYSAEGYDLPFVFGHSLGGLVVLYASLVMGLTPRGLIVSSPALATHTGKLQRKLATWLVGRWPHFTLRNGLPADKLSHDPFVGPDYRQDPLNHARISARLAYFLFAAGRRSLDAAHTLKVPTLLQYAADDHLVDAAGSRAFAAAAPQRKLEAHEYLRLYHEIYNEVEADRSRVVADLLRWLDLQLDKPRPRSVTTTG